MEPTFLLFLALGVVVLALFLGALVFLLTRLLKNLGGGGGGWGRLAEHFTAGTPPAGEMLSRQTVRVGSVVHKNCTTLRWSAQGLYLEARSPFHSPKPLLIPWTQVARVSEGSLYWRKTTILSVGQPEIGTIAVFEDVFQKIRPFLPPSLSWRSGA
jgi:hypothetical protein